MMGKTTGMASGRKLVYKIPGERREFRRDWWRISDAGGADRYRLEISSDNGASWTTAADWITVAGRWMGSKRVLLVGQKRSFMVRCVPPGTGKPMLPGRGNPRMRESEFQREMARRRWGRD